MCKKILVVIAITVFMSACTPAPTPENYLEAIRFADIEKLKAIDKQNFKNLASTQGEARYPLHYAVRRAVYSKGPEHDDVVKYFISLGFDVNEPDQDGNLPLKYAFGNASVIKILTDAGADPNIKDKNGIFPITDAILYRESDSMTALLDAGANLDLYQKLPCKDDCVTLFDAIYQGSDNFVYRSIYKELLKRGFIKKYALHLALKFNDYKALNKLISSESNVNEIYDDDTPLLIVTYRKKIEFVKKLLQAGADPNIRSVHEKESPLWWAVANNDIDAAKILLAAGAEANIADRFGTSPLMYAIQNSNIEMLDMLVNAGAEVDLVTSEWTALDFANENHNRVSNEVFKWLEDHNAVRSSQL